MGFLYKVYRSTERENKLQILACLEPRPGGRLLDLGTNDGSFTVEIGRAARVAAVWGIEALPHLARRAVAQGVHMTVADLNRPFPFADHSFDVVHANQVIEHLSDTDSFVREIRRVLKPNGYAIVSTNNLGSWHNVASLALGYQPMPCHISSELIIGNRLDPRRGQRHPAREDSHLRTFSWSGLRDLCELHGLRVVTMATAGYYPFPPAVARWLSRIDKWHGAFLTVKAVPKRDGPAPG